MGNGQFAPLAQAMAGTTNAITTLEPVKTITQQMHLVLGLFPQHLQLHQVRCALLSTRPTMLNVRGYR